MQITARARSCSVSFPSPLIRLASTIRRCESIELTADVGRRLLQVFEGQGKAVLYTGDVRAEPWFVNALTRSPSMLAYATDCGLGTLDCIYLDTSHTSGGEFQTKAEGLRELLVQVARYPPDTVFHFSSWTYG